MLFPNYDPSFITTQVMNMLLDITSTVYSALEKKFADGIYDTQTTKYKKSETKLSDFRDNLNMAAFIVDNGIITICCDILALQSGVASAGTVWNSRGAVKVTGEKYYNATVLQNEKIEGPSPALMTGMMWASLLPSVMKDINDVVALSAKLAQTPKKREAEHGDEFGNRSEVHLK